MTEKKPGSRFESVKHYLDSQEPEKSKTMTGILDYLIKEFPELETKLAWNNPMLVRKGKYVLGLSCSKNHIAIAPFSKQVMLELSEQLKTYDITENLIRVPASWKLDKILLKELVKLRLQELDMQLKQEPNSKRKI